MISIAKIALALSTLVAAVSGPQAHIPVLRTVRLDSSRFIPAEVRASAGDTIRFVNGNGGPHNVEFLTDSMPKSARPQFEQAMPGGKYKLGPTSGPLLIDPDEAYDVVIPDVPAGRYAFLCLPHQVNMKGVLLVLRKQRTGTGAATGK